MSALGAGTCTLRATLTDGTIVKGSTHVSVAAQQGAKDCCADIPVGDSPLAISG